MRKTRAPIPKGASLQAWTRRFLSDCGLTLTNHAYRLTIMETMNPRNRERALSYSDDALEDSLEARCFQILITLFAVNRT
jgi:hypothetical protein